MQFLYLRGDIHQDADLTVEIDRRIYFMRASYNNQFGPELYDKKTAPLRLKVRMGKAETTLLCVEHT